MYYDVTEGFEAYKIYIAVKQHFTTSYDYFKYNGKTKYKLDSFLRRKDIFFFRKLSRKYKHDELVAYFVSNFVKNSEWIGNLIGEEAERNYIQYRKKVESLNYTFKNDVLFLIDYANEKHININELLLIKNKNHPVLLKLLIQDKITLETVIIMDDILKFICYWNTKMDDFVWEGQSLRMMKYKKFMRFNVEEYKNILKECLKHVDNI